MLPAHPLANLFPLIEGDAFAELVGSIKASGLRDPIVVLDGQVLDGRNRQAACVEAGVDCVYQPFPPDDDPLQFVLDKNLTRRHLDESQRAMVAARLANLEQGRPAANPANLPVKQSDAAHKLSISERALRMARTVQTRAVDELARAVDRGHLAVSVAAAAADLPAEAQRRIAERAEAGDGRAARTVVKQERRQERERILSGIQHALPTKRYGVILADPEWRFEPWSRETGMDRSPDNHYPTSCTEVIAARDVPSIAAPDCVLFLWATVPMLPHALLVMSAWGFDYKSHCIWIKDRVGTGYWFRNQHELLLVGTKGNIPAPAMGEQWVSTFEAPLGAHSEKPEIALQMVETYFPTLPKIELNRRGPPRKGWDAWGYEAEIPIDQTTGEILETPSEAA